MARNLKSLIFTVLLIFSLNIKPTEMDEPITKTEKNAGKFVIGGIAAALFTAVTFTVSREYLCPIGSSCREYLWNNLGLTFNGLIPPMKCFQIASIASAISAGAVGIVKCCKRTNRNRQNSSIELPHTYSKKSCCKRKNH